MIRRFFWVALLSVTTACTAQQQVAEQTGPAPSAEQKAAADLARAQLARQLDVDIAGIEVLSAEAHTWPDSSLGCGKPGAMAAQVITPGFAFTLKSPRGNYRVHAAEKYAVVCGPATQWRSIERSNGRDAGLPLNELQRYLELARADLAGRLGVSSRAIHTEGFTSVEWPDTSMDCPIADETIEKRPIKGYRLGLSYQGRTYTYHTDFKRVRACPAIETN